MIYKICRFGYCNISCFFCHCHLFFTRFLGLDIVTFHVFGIIICCLQRFLGLDIVTFHDFLSLSFVFTGFLGLDFVTFHVLLLFLFFITIYFVD